MTGILNLEFRRGRSRDAGAVRADLARHAVKGARQDKGSEHDAHPERRTAHKPTDGKSFGCARIIPRRAFGPLDTLSSHMLICRLRNLPLRLARSHRPDTPIRTRRPCALLVEIESDVASALLIRREEGSGKAKPWQIRYALKAT